MKPPAAARALPKAISVAEVEALLGRCRGRASHPQALRDRALLEVLYGTGARISEAVGLDLDDVDLVVGSVRLRGKGGKDRVGAARPLRAGRPGRLPGPGPARAGRGRARSPLRSS